MLNELDYLICPKCKKMYDVDIVSFFSSTLCECGGPPASERTNPTQKEYYEWLLKTYGQDEAEHYLRKYGIEGFN